MDTYLGIWVAIQLHLFDQSDSKETFNPITRRPVLQSEVMQRLFKTLHQTKDKINHELQEYFHWLTFHDIIHSLGYHWWKWTHDMMPNQSKHQLFEDFEYVLLIFIWGFHHSNNSNVCQFKFKAHVQPKSIFLQDIFGLSTTAC